MHFHHTITDRQTDTDIIAKRKIYILRLALNTTQATVHKNAVAYKPGVQAVQ